MLRVEAFPCRQTERISDFISNVVKYSVNISITVDKWAKLERMQLV